MRTPRTALLIASFALSFGLAACDDEDPGSGDATMDATATGDATTGADTADTGPDATDRRVEASDFDQSCSFDEMCVIVFDGDVCDCGICPTAAINESAEADFTAAVDALMCPPVDCPAVECAEDKVPSCQDNTCTLRDAIRISADDYDRSCTVDADCVAISEGEVCGGCFGCPTSAISATDQAQYQMDIDHDFQCNPGAVCDCAAGTPVCNAGTCELEEPCFDDAACERGTVCDQLQCVVLRCQSAADCGSDRTCFEGQCTGVECRSDGNCADTEACVDQLCVEGSGQACKSDADCRAPQVCNLIAELCVDPAP